VSKDVELWYAAHAPSMPKVVPAGATPNGKCQLGTGEKVAATRSLTLGVWENGMETALRRRGKDDGLLHIVPPKTGHSQTWKSG
jgi:hypothetical protein